MNDINKTVSLKWISGCREKTYIKYNVQYSTHNNLFIYNMYRIFVRYPLGVKDEGTMKFYFLLSEEVTI